MEVAAAQVRGSFFPKGAILQSYSINVECSGLKTSSVSVSVCPHQLRLRCPPRRRRPLIAVASASSEASSDDIWLLQPIGDGEWRHIGVKVERPGSYQILSSRATVGRVPDKADLVIPVATVSGVHARFEKREGDLYVTDLGSTNGTYVNERRLTPGQPFPLLPGMTITFGDIHLAIFLLSKMQTVIKDQQGDKDPALE